MCALHRSMKFKLIFCKSESIVLYQLINFDWISIWMQNLTDAPKPKPTAAPTSEPTAAPTSEPTAAPTPANSCSNTRANSCSNTRANRCSNTRANRFVIFFQNQIWWKVDKFSLIECSVLPLLGVFQYQNAENVEYNC